MENSKEIMHFYHRAPRVKSLIAAYFSKFHIISHMQLVLFTFWDLQSATSTEVM